MRIRIIDWKWNEKSGAWEIHHDMVEKATYRKDGSLGGKLGSFLRYLIRHSSLLHKIEVFHLGP